MHGCLIFYRYCLTIAGQHKRLGLGLHLKWWVAGMGVHLVYKLVLTVEEPYHHRPTRLMENSVSAIVSVFKFHVILSLSGVCFRLKTLAVSLWLYNLTLWHIKFKCRMKSQLKIFFGWNPIKYNATCHCRNYEYDCLLTHCITISHAAVETDCVFSHTA